MKIAFFYISIFFCVFVCNSNVKAQSFIVKGVIFEKGTNIRIALAEIINKRTQLGIGSNDLGIFEISANVGDTLFIRKRNMLDQQLVVRGQQDLIIHLVREVNQLEDVTIRGQTKKQDLAEIKEEFRNKGVYNDGKSSVLSTIFHPLNAIYNLFGSEPKNARRFSRYADNEIKQSQIDVYFNATIITNNSNLTGKNLEKFMLDYRPAFEKAQYWNSYDYIKYIKESSKKFTDTLGRGN